MSRARVVLGSMDHDQPIPIMPEVVFGTAVLGPVFASILRYWERTPYIDIRYVDRGDEAYASDIDPAALNSLPPYTYAVSAPLAIGGAFNKLFSSVLSDPLFNIDPERSSKLAEALTALEY